MDRRRILIWISLLASLLASACVPRDEAVPAVSPKSEATSFVPATPVPPPPPPPELAVTLVVEFPDGRVVEARVSDEDCRPARCDMYAIGGFVDAAFRKAGMDVRSACTGPMGRRACEITAIGGIANSARGHWVMFRNGHRNTYPYNQVMHEQQPQRIVYRFLSSSDPNP